MIIVSPGADNALTPFNSILSDSEVFNIFCAEGGLKAFKLVETRALHNNF